MSVERDLAAVVEGSSEPVQCFSPFVFVPSGHLMLFLPLDTIVLDYLFDISSVGVGPVVLNVLCD